VCVVVGVGRVRSCESSYTFSRKIKGIKIRPEKVWWEAQRQLKSDYLVMEVWWNNLLHIMNEKRVTRLGI